MTVWLVGADPDTGEFRIVEAVTRGEPRYGMQTVRVGSVLHTVPAAKCYRTFAQAAARRDELEPAHARIAAEQLRANGRPA